MKGIILFCFVSLSIQTFGGQNLLKEEIQKKKIKVKKAFLIAEKANEKGVSDSVLVYEFIFDKSGRPLRNASYYEGMEMITSEYEYDSKGQKIKLSTNNNKIHMKNDFSYKYDEKGNITEETCYEGKEVEYRKVSKYNSDGKKILELKMAEDKKIETKSVFAYDQHGNLINSKTFDSNDSIGTNYVYAYDVNNNLTSEIRYNGRRLEWNFDYQYNDRNQKIRESHNYPAGTSNSTIKFKYDLSGHLIEETTFNSAMQAIQKESFRYENDKLIEEQTGNLKTIYEYDASGNKTKEAVYSDDGGLSIKSFNSRGDLVSFKQYYSDQKFSYEENYQYDVVTNLKIKLSKRNTDQTISEDIEYKYNTYGDMIEQISKDNNTHILTINKFVYQYYE